MKSIYVFLFLLLNLIAFRSQTGCKASREDQFHYSECDSVVDKSHMNGMNYLLFQGTPVCQLAIKLIKNGDTIGATHFIRTNNIDLNFKEEKFGATLLIQSVYWKRNSCCELLLKTGADINIKSFPEGYSPIIAACSIDDDSLKVLKTLLSYGANVNDSSKAETEEFSKFRTTPLLTACSIGVYDKVSFERVKLLIASGAYINYADGYGHTPLGQSIISEHYEIALFLLEHGADYKLPVLKMVDGTDAYIQNILRQSLLPLDSPNYIWKMKVVEFLEKKGVSYRDTPILPSTLEDIKRKHPNDWEEYLSKY